MSQKITLSCRCGAVAMQAQNPPILSVECLCTSCRTAASIMDTLPGAQPIREASGGTRMEMYRKDRVHCTKGAQHLREFRLTATTKSRRVVAACCNTPMFLDFTQGHWIDLYGTLWPAGTLPPLQMRTMTGDLDDPSTLPGDVPNLKSHSPRFFIKLISAWAAMKFRTPKIDVQGKLDLPL
ncbi:MULTISPECIES: GFA family protein [unclassified Yoonia]|uniref:GFA family protein n=1 Tax=unclassified Yoonia TaxID=2629118 RepID=UPI002AFFB55D|nr:MULTISPECIES: DUF6151 family protein [unclassified Yoonia]